jgi:hypothetical protein
VIRCKESGAELKSPLSLAAVWLLPALSCCHENRPLQYHKEDLETLKGYLITSTEPTKEDLVLPFYWEQTSLRDLLWNYLVASNVVKGDRYK